MCRDGRFRLSICQVRRRARRSCGTGYPDETTSDRPPGILARNPKPDFENRRERRAQKRSLRRFACAGLRTGDCQRIELRESGRAGGVHPPALHIRIPGASRRATHIHQTKSVAIRSAQRNNRTPRSARCVDGDLTVTCRVNLEPLREYSIHGFQQPTGVLQGGPWRSRKFLFQRFGYSVFQILQSVLQSGILAIPSLGGHLHHIGRVGTGRNDFHGTVSDNTGNANTGHYGLETLHRFRISVWRRGAITYAYPIRSFIRRPASGFRNRTDGFRRTRLMGKPPREACRPVLSSARAGRSRQKGPGGTIRSGTWTGTGRQVRYTKPCIHEFRVTPLSGNSGSGRPPSGSIQDSQRLHPDPPSSLAWSRPWSASFSNASFSPSLSPYVCRRNGSGLPVAIGP